MAPSGEGAQLHAHAHASSAWSLGEAARRGRSARRPGEVACSRLQGRSARRPAERVCLPNRFAFDFAFCLADPSLSPSRLSAPQEAKEAETKAKEEVANKHSPAAKEKKASKKEASKKSGADQERKRASHRAHCRRSLSHACDARRAGV